jgi:hypothetical protein
LRSLGFGRGAPNGSAVLGAAGGGAALGSDAFGFVVAAAGVEPAGLPVVLAVGVAPGLALKFGSPEANPPYT